MYKVSRILGALALFLSLGACSTNNAPVADIVKSSKENKEVAKRTEEVTDKKIVETNIKLQDILAKSTIVFLVGFLTVFLYVFFLVRFLMYQHYGYFQDKIFKLLGLGDHFLNAVTNNKISLTRLGFICAWVFGGYFAAAFAILVLIVSQINIGHMNKKLEFKQLINLLVQWFSINALVAFFCFLIFDYDPDDKSVAIFVTINTSYTAGIFATLLICFVIYLKRSNDNANDPDNKNKKGILSRLLSLF